MCRMAPQVVFELEHFGMPFDRNDDGTIYQRPFGGHSANFGETIDPARVRGRRPHRPRDAAHAVPAQRARAHAVLRRVDGARPHARRRRRRARRRRLRNGNRRGHDPAGEGDDPRHRRRRAHLRGVDQRLHQHRRRPRHGRARGPAARGHGVLAVPPHGRGRRRRADHRRRARRGRDPAQLQRRALHGALRAEPEGSRVARRRVALDGPGDQGRPRLRTRQGLRPAQARSPRPRGHQQAPAVDPRDRASSSPTSIRSRSRFRWCRRSTTRWAASRPTSTGSAWRRSPAMRVPWFRASTRWANARACRCTAPTGSAPTRCSTCWCSGGRPATTSSSRT